MSAARTAVEIRVRVVVELRMIVASVAERKIKARASLKSNLSHLFTIIYHVSANTSTVQNQDAVHISDSHGDERRAADG
ncbi:MAG: hypothetical protein NDJ92_02845 [Thermoanaerobaculia bacterium]|nr:hypothetical protein [Thermoanaerobaculia bacterium]